MQNQQIIAMFKFMHISQTCKNVKLTIDFCLLSVFAVKILFRQTDKNPAISRGIFASSFCLPKGGFYVRLFAAD